MNCPVVLFSEPKLKRAGVEAGPMQDPPLCVDLDGTLTPVDSLHENLLGLVKQSPRAVLAALRIWLRQGKAAFKGAVAGQVQTDAQSLPYRQDLIDWLKAERARGRWLVLATASHKTGADEVARHLQLFDEVVATTADNLSGEGKRQALIERFGEKGFDYVGNARADQAVWRSARQAVVVGGEPIVERARRVSSVAKVFPVERPSPALWLKAMRLHQWVKNVLLFIPALLAHSIVKPQVLVPTLLAFLAFGLCASSVYLVNDLLDLPADRRHPRKRNRPFASGAISVQSGMVAAGLLLAAAAAVAVMVNRDFCATLGVYYAVTCAYTLRLKRAAPVDVMTLAGLYTLRVIAGAMAGGVLLSFWLLAFSIFIFVSLGTAKRYTELDGARQVGKSSSAGRSYSVTDLSVLMSLGTSSGYCAIVVMALYINSPDSQLLYAHNKPLWLICPLLLYWISRVWLLTGRGQMHDDPIVFALRDRISLGVLALMAGAVLTSI
jgi:4-hydroxybenzoate polyprenyltransferase/phosphoserine phosphatase